MIVQPIVSTYTCTKHAYHFFFIFRFLTYFDSKARKSGGWPLQETIEGSKLSPYLAKTNTYEHRDSHTNTKTEKGRLAKHPNNVRLPIRSFRKPSALGPWAGTRVGPDFGSSVERERAKACERLLRDVMFLASGFFLSYRRVHTTERPFT